MSLNQKTRAPSQRANSAPGGPAPQFGNLWVNQFFGLLIDDAILADFLQIRCTGLSYVYKRLDDTFNTCCHVIVV
jgi:hypothetical protein